MAVTKNALIRYQTLDKCFRNTGRKYLIDDLLEEVNKALRYDNPNNEGIKMRQLRDDIRFMRSESGYSIELAEGLKIGKKMIYRYEDPKFSINNEPINEAEANQLKAALQVITRFSGAPEFQWVNEMIPQLESKFGLIKQEKEVISFQSNIDLKGLDFLTPLFNAIVNKRVLHIQYKDFKNEESFEWNFHPYYLKQYNNRWFCLGLNPEEPEIIWNIALDRIENLSETDLKYQESDIDWDEYFYDVIGVTRYQDKEPVTVELFFDSSAIPYVRTKPLHPSQKDYEEESGYRVKIKVIPNYELESLILSYGQKVEVLAPADLRERITHHLKSALSKYEE